MDNILLIVNPNVITQLPYQLHWLSIYAIPLPLSFFLIQYLLLFNSHWDLGKSFHDALLLSILSLIVLEDALELLVLPLSLDPTPGYPHP